jgi:hypothetical protein
MINTKELFSRWMSTEGIRFLFQKEDGTNRPPDLEERLFNAFQAGIQMNRVTPRIEDTLLQMSQEMNAIEKKLASIARSLSK